MEIRFTVDDNYIKDLQSKVKGAKTTQIASEALALFNWAVSEIMNGKKVVSLDEGKNSYKEITTPVLQNVTKEAPELVAG
jgi:hypothetical protein